MKNHICGLALLVLLLCFPGAASAHRVNIFAFADGDAVQVECYFTRSQKVRQGKLTFTDLATGEKLLEGTTDEQGLFRFRPGPDFLETGHGVRILLNAGEGHQSDWEISPQELAALSPGGSSVKSALGPAAEQAAGAAPEGGEQAVAPAVIPDAAELEALLDRVLEAKLAPIRQTLARQAESGPNLRDVVGGIGWIIGLLGLAAYLRYRR